MTVTIRIIALEEIAIILIDNFSYYTDKISSSDTDSIGDYIISINSNKTVVISLA